MIQALLREVIEQLSKISMPIDGVEDIIQKKYINLQTSYDMEPFVDVIGCYYHIKVCEHRVVIYDYKTSDVKKAAYIILEDYTYKQEYNKLEDRFKYSMYAGEMIREIQGQYFKAFGDVYVQYFEKGISVGNLGF